MKITGIFVVALAAFSIPASAQTGWNGDANLLLAGKSLQQSEWGDTDHQGEIGLQTTWQGPSWPIAIAADFSAAGHNAAINEGGFTEQKGDTTELDLGVRKIWRPAPYVRPYIGGGLDVASASLERTGPAGTESDSGSGAGLWLGGGVFWTLSQAFNIGLDAKLSHADVSLFGNDVNAGGFHLGLLLGYHWGG